MCRQPAGQPHHRRLAKLLPDDPLRAEPLRAKVVAAPLSSPDDAGVVALEASSRSARTARTSRAAAMASSFWAGGRTRGGAGFVSPAIPRQQLAMAPRAFLLQHTQMQQQPSSTRPPKPTKE